MKTNLIQKSKIGVAGSFVNQLMSNNDTIPVVGKGATSLHYSDRSCYEVIEVSEDLKTVKLEALDARIDPEYLASLKGRDCIGHQNWILEPTGNYCTVVYRRGAWRTKDTIITFTKEFCKKHEGAISYARQLTPEQREAIYAGGGRPRRVVEGITEQKIIYTEIKLLFGQKDYYYDWTF